MGIRFLDERVPSWASDYIYNGIMWCSKPGTGKWYKRRLSKLRRAAIKRELRGLHPRKARLNWESECNWKGS
jgi:hypothetical protein